VRALPVPIVQTTAAGDALHGVRTGGSGPQEDHLFFTLYSYA
jgi:hypothetical protein